MRASKPSSIGRRISAHKPDPALLALIDPSCIAIARAAIASPRPAPRDSLAPEREVQHTPAGVKSDRSGTYGNTNINSDVVPGRIRRTKRDTRRTEREMEVQTKVLQAMMHTTKN